MSLVFALFTSFWFFLPAYVANPAAVLFGGRRPIDGGRVLADGNRLFGDGKTWRGFVGGVASGAVIGALQWGIASAVYAPLGYGSIPEGVLVILALPAGSLLGDLTGAFVKRRMGLPRGAKSPLLDAYDFLLGGFALLALTSSTFFRANYVTGEAIYGLLFVIVITPGLHRAVNLLGHRLGRKDVPW